MFIYYVLRWPWQPRPGAHPFGRRSHTWLARPKLLVRRWDGVVWCFCSPGCRAPSPWCHRWTTAPVLLVRRALHYLFGVYIFLLVNYNNNSFLCRSTHSINRRFYAESEKLLGKICTRIWRKKQKRWNIIQFPTRNRSLFLP